MARKNFKSVKRKDARDRLPVGIMYASTYCGSGLVVPNSRVRAYALGKYKSFSIKKYGRETAIELALYWRLNQLLKGK